MSILDSIKRFFGGAPAPDPRRDPAPPRPERAPPAPASPVPAAVLTLGRDEADVTTPRADTPRRGRYRRPSSVPSGTFEASRVGRGIALYRDGRRVSTVYPYEQAGANDLGLQLLTWQMLLNAVESQDRATVVIDDRYHEAEERELPELDGPDVDGDGIADLDPGARTLNERNAIAGLESLGYETVVPKADPVPPPAPAPTVPAPSEVRTLKAPDPTPAVPPPSTQDSWSPSGAYER